MHAQGSIVFQCTWDSNKPINISVDPSNKTATRDDGGLNYSVIKLTKYAVWLVVTEPTNQVGMKMQMIQQGEAVNNKAGKWVDVVFSMSGSVSPIEGG